MESPKTELQERIRQAVDTAVAESCAMSASAAFSAMCYFYDIKPDEQMLTLGSGILIPTEQGEKYNAFAGICQFLAFALHRKGGKQKDIAALCSAWRDAFCTVEKSFDCRLEASDLFCAVLEAGFHFAASKEKLLGLKQTNAHPRHYYEQIYSDREAMFTHSPYALEEKLSKAVTRGDRDAALSALQEITSRGEKAVVAKDPLRSAKNSMIGSIAFLARATIQAGVNADKAFALSDSLIKCVEDMSTKAEVLAFEESILLQFIDIVNLHLEGEYSAPVTRTMHYIENHLDKKITLGDAAKYAGVHPAYLSSKFKKETGCDFSNYVCQRKIQESTYFVRHTGYSISQIAALYGFSGQSYYITQFRKFIGMTPGDYRSRFWAD